MENNEITQTFGEENTPTPKRSSFLQVICILSFIGSGFSIFGGLIYTLFLDDIIDVLIESGIDFYIKLADALSAIPKSYFGAEFVLAIGSLVGVLFMWRLKKVGFHIYTISNLLILGLPLFFNVGSFNLFGLIFPTGPFIVMYALNYKQMK